MSAAARAAGEKLRAKYARVFGVPIEDVEMETWPDDEEVNAEVWCKGRPELPKWSLK